MSKSPKHLQPSAPPIWLKNIIQFIDKTAPFLSFKIFRKLFFTPIDTPFSGAEKKAKKNIQHEYINVQGVKIRTYKWQNTGTKKALLMHGWSGRGTHFHRMAAQLIQNHYSVYSLDAPNHGESEGKMVSMLSFIDCLEKMHELHGTFDLVIGHSLGGMAIANAQKKFALGKKLVLISAPNTLQDILDNFALRIGVSNKTAQKIMTHINELLDVDFDANHSASSVLPSISVPVLFIHDKDDPDVPIERMYENEKAAKNKEVFVTQQLGHKIILKNTEVLEKITEFAAD